MPLVKKWFDGWIKKTIPLRQKELSKDPRVIQLIKNAWIFFQTGGTLDDYLKMIYHD